jgi:hypothetical protein
MLFEPGGLESGLFSSVVDRLTGTGAGQKARILGFYLVKTSTSPPSAVHHPPLYCVLLAFLAICFAALLHFSFASSAGAFESSLR